MVITHLKKRKGIISFCSKCSDFSIHKNEIRMKKLVLFARRVEKTSIGNYIVPIIRFLFR